MENKEFNLRNFLYNNPLLEGEDKKEKEEHEEGAIADDRDHIDALDADAEADEMDDDERNTFYDNLDSVPEQTTKSLREQTIDVISLLKKERQADNDVIKDFIKTHFNDIRGASPSEIVDEFDEFVSVNYESPSDYMQESEVEDEEDVDVDVKKDVNVDIEDEVTIDDETEESEIEVDSELSGEDAETAGVLGLLTKAQAEAEALGDEKLMDQIGNTITYFTRAHVVKSTETRAVAETKLFTRRR